MAQMQACTTSARLVAQAPLPLLLPHKAVRWNMPRCPVARCQEYHRD
jgi:hypothetical protein